MNRSLILLVTAMTTGLFVAILAANIVHDQIVIHQVRNAIYQVDRPVLVEKAAFRQWKIDYAPVYPALSSVIDDPGYPTQTSDLGSIYFGHYRPAYIRWAEKQVP